MYIRVNKWGLNLQVSRKTPIETKGNFIRSSLGIQFTFLFIFPQYTIINNISISV